MSRHFVLGMACAFLGVAAEADNIREVEPDELADLRADAGPPIKLLRLLHGEAGIEIDGHIDEPVWQRIVPFGHLRMIEPDTLETVPYDTDTRIFYTERGMYVSFDMEQPADTLIQRYAPRDAYDINRDNVGFTLDTSGDGRYGYWMNLSLGDSEMDGTILPERQYGRDWDGAWYGATQRTPRGWSAEFFIPWSQVAMPKSDGRRQIGIYMSRKVAHLDERWGWPALPGTRPRFISDFQKLELADVDPPQQWSLFPYTSATYDRIQTDTAIKAGADIFWRPTSNFQLTATVNPDFGSVESDDVVVNLTANETFFPEKRLFFQEGQDIFELVSSNNAGGQPPPTVVNTRRIGGKPRSVDLPDGVALSQRDRLTNADVIAASKATGQFGRIRYGLLAASEDDTDFLADDGLGYTVDGRDFGVFRVLYEDSEGAAYRGLGWISTIVAHPETDAVVHGADFHYLTDSGRWNFDGQLLYSDLDESGTGSGATADITFTPRQGLRHRLQLSSLDDGLDINDLGFQVRNNVDDVRYRIEWTKSGLQRLRNFRITPFFRYERNGEGFRTSNAIVMNASATFNNLHRLETRFGYFPKRFDDRNSFGNGTYAVRGRSTFNLNYRTDTSQPVSLFGRVNYRGEEVYGDMVESELGVSWRPRDNLNIEVEATHIDRDGWLLHQEDRNFTTFRATQWRPEFNVEFYPSSKQQLRVALQWVGIRAEEDRFFSLPVDDTTLVEGPKPDTESDSFSISQLNFQVRYRWQIAPLSDLFVVYTKGDSQRGDLDEFGDLFNRSWQDPLGDQLVVKLRYRLGS